MSFLKSKFGQTFLFNCSLFVCGFTESSSQIAIDTGFPKIGKIETCHLP